MSSDEGRGKVVRETRNRKEHDCAKIRNSKYEFEQFKIRTPLILQTRLGNPVLNFSHSSLFRVSIFRIWILQFKAFEFVSRFVGASFKRGKLRVKSLLLTLRTITGFRMCVSSVVLVFSS